jgi:hypothetical protein
LKSLYYIYNFIHVKLMEVSEFSEFVKYDGLSWEIDSGNEIQNTIDI